MGTEEKEWANLLSEVFDTLTAKHAQITYDFDSLRLAGEKNGEGGTKIPTGVVTLTGKLTISTN